MKETSATISLSDHFTYKRLLRFVLPSIFMMVFTSIYGVVDGFFVSNFLGKSALAAVNLIWPVFMIMGAIGFMIGAGGTSIISQALGEDNEERANNSFSLFTYTAFIIGLVLAVLGIVFIKDICHAIGATGKVYDECIRYGIVLFVSLPFFMWQNMFQSFLVTAEKPNLGMWFTIIAGVINMGLDYLFIGPLNMGVAGAGLATSLSQIAGGLVPFLYFLFWNKSRIRLVRCHIDWNALLRAFANGSSELVSNVSSSIIGILYNLQLLKYAGENGVAAYGVLMYVNFVFVSILIGYSVGIVPLIGYNHGAQNHKELRGLFSKSMRIVPITGITLTILCFISAPLIAKIFVGYDEELCAMTIHAFRISSILFSFCGFPVFGSSLFTSLGNGFVSATISFVRTFLMQIVAIYLLPLVFGVDGIWMSAVVADIFAFLMTMIFIVKYKSRYHY